MMFLGGGAGSTSGRLSTIGRMSEAVHSRLQMLLGYRSRQPPRRRSGPLTPYLRPCREWRSARPHASRSTCPKPGNG